MQNILNSTQITLKMSAKFKRKSSSQFPMMDKENPISLYQKNTDSILQKNVAKRLCLGTLSSNKNDILTSNSPASSLVTAVKSLDLCISQNFQSFSQDSHDSGFSQNLSQASPIHTNQNTLDTSLDMDQSDLDELNTYCLQNSAFNNRVLNSSCHGSNDSFGSSSRRCLFKDSPMGNSFKSIKTFVRTPKKSLFGNDDSFNTTTTPKAKGLHKKMLTPVSISRHTSLKSVLNGNFTTFAEQSITSIEKMLEETTNHSNSILKIQHDQIKESLDIECQDKASTYRLIGDRSKYHILPTKTSIKHNDLSVISTETLEKVLKGDYEAEIDNLMVIDSRYPYEYEGGHIQNAENLYTKEQMFEKFLSSDKLKKINEKANSNGKRAVIIFHCEFSSERGPGMLRFLRNQDRTLNKDIYPALFYPELYLLEGGYKAFYEKNQILCEPRLYKPMLHENHTQDLKHFRAKTKTWNRHGSSAMISARKNCLNINKSRLQRFPRSTLF